MTSPKSKEQVVPEEVLVIAGELVNSALRNYENNVFASVSRDAIAAALIAERKPPQWQPINDEAKNGQRIIALEHFDHTWIDDEGEPQSRPGDCEVVFWSKKHSAWIGFGMMLESFAPTHWMPLPTPPKGGEE